MILEQKRLDWVRRWTILLASVAALAGRNDVVRGIAAALADGYHMVLRQPLRLLPAVGATSFVRCFDGLPLFKGKGGGKIALQSVPPLLVATLAIAHMLGISNHPSLDRPLVEFLVFLSPFTVVFQLGGAIAGVPLLSIGSTLGLGRICTPRYPGALIYSIPVGFLVTILDRLSLVRIALQPCLSFLRQKNTDLPDATLPHMAPVEVGMSIIPRMAAA